MRRVRRSSRIAVVTLALVPTLGPLACLDEDPLGDSQGDANADTDGNTATNPDEDTSGSVDDDGVWLPARGIAIKEIEANQGTRVAITDADGEWIGPAARNMKLVSDRDTLIRVHWVVDPDWRPRRIKARLTLDLNTTGSATGQDSVIVREQTLDVAGDSSPTALGRAFYFGLVADEGETVPGARIQVELLEADVDHDRSVPERIPTAPVAGPQLLGFESDPMQIKVMLVPIRYTGEGNDRIAELTDDRVQQLIDGLYENNPVQQVIYQVRGHIGYDEPMTNLGSLLPLMAAAKQKDGADANVYYHAFIDIGCPVVGCGSSGVAGIAAVAASSKNASLNRVGASVFWTSTNGDIPMTVDTFVHEVGHNQGLSHVACPGVDAASPDPSFPYFNGTIGQWGFGIRSYSLHNPTASHDYMSYCGNNWGSDWTFLKTYTRIRELTSWDYSDYADNHPANPKQTKQTKQTMGEDLIVGALYPDGSEQWFSMPGAIDMDEIVPSETMLFEFAGLDDGLDDGFDDGLDVVEQPAVIQTLSDGETQWVIAPLPEGRSPDELGRVEHRRHGEIRRVVPREQIVTHLGDLVSAGTNITR